MTGDIEELISAARRGDFTAVSSMIERGVPADGRSEVGNNALVELVKSVTAHSGSGETPQAVDAVEALVRAGADPDVRYRSSVARIGFGSGEIEGYEAGEEHETALYYAAKCNCTHIATRLIEAGAYVDTSDSDMVTPLMMAARHGNTAMIGALVSAGADADRTDRHEKRAIDYARDGATKRALKQGKGLLGWFGR